MIVTFEYVASALGWGVFPSKATTVDPAIVQRRLRDVTEIAFASTALYMRGTWPSSWT
jgi:hypothetical protein